MSGKALEGMKVLEYAEMVSGPYLGKLLADLGAEVIKVEPPQGDPARYCGPFPGPEKDPEQSALFLYVNTSKRGITLDIETPEGLAAFKKLLCWADVFIDNHLVGSFDHLGLDWESVHRLNPALIYASITPYGRTGPRAKAKGGELTLIQAGGEGNLIPARSFDLSFPPVKFGGYQVGYHGALFAAVGVMALYLARKKTGVGRLLDVSLQECVINLLPGTLHNHRYDGFNWSRVPDRPPAMGRMQTQDGYVTLGANDDHHFRALRELMGKPDWLADDRWDDRVFRTKNLMHIGQKLDEWMKGQQKQEIYHKLAQAGIPIGPINNAEEVINNAQYRARGFFVEVKHPRAGKYEYAGWPYKLSASPPKIFRPAPLLGQHNEEVAREILDRRDLAPSNPPPLSIGNNTLPLTGLRILDFSWVWAGPYATMLLANLGAEVIKVEGHKRTDIVRRAVMWPRWEPEPYAVPPNQGLSYNSVNRDKKSLTLDLSRPEGVVLAKRLAAVSDVVIDNMRPDAMRKMGLGYEDLVRIKPDLIVVSTSSRGQTGPESRYLGFAQIHQSVSGVAYISGYPEDHPTYGSLGHTDITNATTTAFIILAAVHYRERTGQGQFIDQSQCEGSTCLIGEQLLGYLMNGKIPERQGNRHPEYAPHNVYPCWGVDRWLALEIHNDEEFRALARIMGRPELADDPRFRDRTARKKNEAELDRIISEWTRQRDRDWMVEEMLKAGLAAAPSRDAEDLYADRHLRARNFFIKVQHPERGELELAGLPWRISGLDLPKGRAPLLGEHNAYVLMELLGLSAKEVEDLRTRGIIL
jgi:crotonobetainyl-CoA:carnitine CoA-transferase CaiB-like acyl-CoA transferase